MKRLLIIFLLFFVLITPAQAQAISPTLRASLIQQLQVLIAQVTTLQSQLAILKEKEAESVRVPPQKDIYPTDFYNGKYETVYSISGNQKLIPKITSSVRPGDKALFETFVDLAGEDFIDTYLFEFRIFNDDDTQLGAFVQQKINGDWILAVNRFDENLLNTHENDGLTELLLHEYAHIVFFEDTDIAEEFFSTFWDTSLMRNHNRNTGDITDVNKRFNVNSEFYNEYKSMFVSEYAASSPDEDLVESFTNFVLTDKPDGDTIAEKKVLFFYNYTQMKLLRLQLRGSGVLTLR